MKPIFSDTRFLEQTAKRLFHFPEFIMMENAAAAMEKEVLSALDEIDGKACKNYSETTKDNKKSDPLVVILCGSGNNGGDGYALSRRLFGKCTVLVLSFGGTKTDEAKRQAEMAFSCGVRIVEAESAAYCNYEETFNSARVFVDCLYGSGFHGELNEKSAAFIEKINSIEGKKIACDISSGIDSFGRILSKDSRGERLAFKADKTIVMGALKAALFSDEAKDFTGRIEVAELGISRDVFEKCNSSTLFDYADSAPANQCKQSEDSKPAMQSRSNDFLCSSECKAFPTAYLLEKTDITLPERNKNNVHKGQFGHCAVVIGEKAGAAIIAGTAALKSGAGLATCVHFSKHHNFLMNPELMEDASFPEKTSAVLLGCGLGRTNTAAFNSTLNFIFEMKNPACVFDADFFYYDKIGAVLEKLCKMENARVILTPHPKELFALAKNCGINEITEKFAIEMRFEATKKIAALFPRIVLIAKGANTLIAHGNELFVSEFGSPALAKAGSGDVLAGFCAGLIAQGFNALEAAKTAVYLQGSASRLFENRWELSPLDLTRLSTAEDSLLFHF